ncbi:MAG: hypothetical protein IKU17_04275 [Clostridia bacterium]|nr:hypothetical protein [Clostridia bacterium]
MTDKEKMSRWQEDFTVSSFDAGPNRTLKLSRLLLWLQETAERHLKVFGMGYEALHEAGLVFLTARTWLKVHRMPRFGETISIVTRPCGTQKAQFLRGYEIYAGEELCAEAVQTSVAANPQSHKILHPREFDRFGFDPACGGKPALIPPKLKMPELPVIGERVIRYSDLDYNNHLNNAVYADFLPDHLPGGMEGRRITELQINYINESFLGDTLTMHGSVEEEKFTMYGNNARGRGFEAYAVLKSM